MFRIISRNSSRNKLKIESNCLHLFKRQFYDARTKNETIFAPATSCQSGSKGSPLGVIRISGPNTCSVINELTNLFPVRHKSEFKTKYKNLLPRLATLTRICSPNKPKDLIDIGLVLWFPAPNSYTGEDVCEFHVHGSQAIMRNLLDQLGLIKGLRPAEGGEFTKRAVFNKKMSLIQAESLPDLIASRTDKQRQLALKGLDGSTIEKYDSLEKQLIEILAHLEASIDFGEDELIGEEKVINECISKLNLLSDSLLTFIRLQAQSRRFIQDGFNITIMGRPNVGKSSLMNKLCLREKSIVSPTSGTTRDIVEEFLELGGHRLSLSDTAGLKEIFSNHDCHKIQIGHDLVEQEGIRRAIKAGAKSDVIIYVLDEKDLYNRYGMAVVGHEIGRFLREVQSNSDENDDRTVLCYLVLNKLDLMQDMKDCRHRLDEVVNSLKEQTIKFKDKCQVLISDIMLSCETEENINSFRESLVERLDSFVISHTNDKKSIDNLEFVNERHLSLLKKCQWNLNEASKMRMSNIDQMAQHVREATDYLSRCIGTIHNEEVLDKIFTDFCIGK